MVKVKMDYNPYLMETKVKFNNKEPRINSLIEKVLSVPYSNVGRTHSKNSLR